MSSLSKRRRILNNRRNLIRYLFIKLNDGCTKCGEVKDITRICKDIKILHRDLTDFLTRRTNIKIPTINKLEWSIWKQLNAEIFQDSIKDGDSNSEQEVSDS